MSVHPHESSEAVRETTPPVISVAVFEDGSVQTLVQIEPHQIPPGQQDVVVHSEEFECRLAEVVDELMSLERLRKEVTAL